MVVIGTLITCIVAIICYRQVRRIDKLASRIYMLYAWGRIKVDKNNDEDGED